MAYILDGSTIRSPNELSEASDTQVVQIRTLDGTISRDYFGDTKRVWVLEYNNAKKTDYDTINAIYQAYISTAIPITWESTETNYTFASTDVHVDLVERGFSVKGTDYLSDFTLTLTEN